MAGGADLLFGPILIGVFLNCILYGIFVVQTFVYFQTYKGDPRWFKIFVTYLLFCETLNTACDILLIYEPVIIRYGTERALTVAPFMLSLDPALTVLVSTPVQFFIAWRVKVTSRSIIVPIIIGFFAIAAFAGGVATAVSVVIINHYADFHKFYGAPITWLASSTAADILITAALVHNLVSTVGCVLGLILGIDYWIIRMTVQTGLITSVFAAVDMLLFLLIRHATFNFILDLALSKLYSNSLLSTLNSRGGWKATSSVRSNVLFGNGTDVESISISRTRPQIEFMTVDPRTVAGRPSNMVPMKVFDPDASYHDQLPGNDTSKFVHEV